MMTVDSYILKLPTCGVEYSYHRYRSRLVGFAGSHCPSDEH